MPHIIQRCIAVACLFQALISPAVHASEFSIATYNVENYVIDPGAGRPFKSLEARAAVVAMITKAAPDVLALQEINSPAALGALCQSLAEAGAPYPYTAFSPGFDTNAYVALISRLPITRITTHTNEGFLLFGRRYQTSRGILETEVEIRPGARVIVFNSHLKSRRPVGFADEAELREEEALILRRLVDERFQANPRALIAIAGDFNDHPSSRPVRTIIGRGKFKLTDPRPILNPSEPAPGVAWTHYFDDEDTYSRIDFILLSPALAPRWRPERSRVVRLPMWRLASDHCPVVVHFNLP